MAPSNAKLKIALMALFVVCATSCLFYLPELNIFTGNVHPILFQRLLADNSIMRSNLALYLGRHHHVLENCHKLGYKSDYYSLTKKYYNHQLDHIIVDSKNKLLYCYVPKIACTNWKRIFMVLTGYTNVTDIFSIPANVAHRKDVFLTLGNYSLPEIIYMLHTYVKFLFVRHPFERLLSAYRNKLEQHYNSSKYFQTRFGRYIVKHYRTNPSNESLDKGHDVTFREFASYVTGKDSVFNEHWRPVYDLCHPCLIHYDIVGKYETLYDDARAVLRFAPGANNITFPSITPSGTSSIMKKYFSTLSQKTISDLYSIYQLDFKLFDYKINDIYNI